MGQRSLARSLVLSPHRSPDKKGRHVSSTCEADCREQSPSLPLSRPKLLPLAHLTQSPSLSLRFLAPPLARASCFARRKRGREGKYITLCLPPRDCACVPTYVASMQCRSRCHSHFFPVAVTMSS